MPVDLQPTHLQDELIRLAPLKKDDLEQLYKVAADPLIWEQHPQKLRYQQDVFQAYFDGAVESGGAFIVLDAETNAVIGSSRYYDLDESEGRVAIGFTFLARSHCGGRFNRSLKRLMIDHAFAFVDSVIFHIGANNLRSQKATEKFGAVKVAEVVMPPPTTSPQYHFVYEIRKADWLNGTGAANSA